MIKIVTVIAVIIRSTNLCRDIEQRGEVYASTQDNRKS